MREDNVWLTPQDVQDQYGMKIGSQANLRSHKMITFYKRGRYIRYLKSDMDSYFLAGKVAVAS